jgi:hypothetical protein
MNASMSGSKNPADQGLGGRAGMEAKYTLTACAGGRAGANARPQTLSNAAVGR